MGFVDPDAPSMIICQFVERIDALIPCSNLSWGLKGGEEEEEVKAIDSITHLIQGFIIHGNALIA